MDMRVMDVARSSCDGTVLSRLYQQASFLLYFTFSFDIRALPEFSLYVRISVFDVLFGK